MCKARHCVVYEPGPIHITDADATTLSSTEFTRRRQSTGISNSLNSLQALFSTLAIRRTRVSLVLICVNVTSFVSDARSDQFIYVTNTQFCYYYHLLNCSYLIILHKVCRGVLDTDSVYGVSRTINIDMMSWAPRRKTKNQEALFPMRSISP